MTEPRIITELDLVAIEREAREMRARVIAEGFRTATAWLRNRFSRGAEPRTA